MSHYQSLTQTEVDFYHSRLTQLYRDHKGIRQEPTLDLLLKSFRDDLQALTTLPATRWQITRLRKRLMKNFVRAIAQIDNNCRESSLSYAAYQFKQTPTYLGVRNLKLKTDARQVNQQLVSAISAKAPAAALPMPTAPVRATFPDLPIVSENILAPLSWLRVRWNTADSIATLTSEDRFMLDQIAATYLPDSWKIFKDLRGQPRSTLTAAAQMLEEQIITLINQVDEIIDNGGQNAMSKLAAQTAFIQTKRTTTSRLTLNR